MSIPDVCLAGGAPGSGGVVGGGGDTGVPSVNVPGAAAGAAASSTGFPMIRLTSNMKATITVKLYDTLLGENPADLDQYESIKFIAKEIETDETPYIEKTATVTDAAEGELTVSFKGKNIPYAGVWPSAFVCYDTDGEIIGEYRCYLYIEYGTSNYNPQQVTRPLSIFEVRMALIDMSPEYNTLIEDFEFSDVQITYAIRRPVDEWNESPPCLTGHTYTASTFPWREFWLRATCAHLLRMAGHHYSRNNLRYNAGGVSVQDKDKMNEYMTQADMLFKEWKEWMMLTKREININACFGTISSPSFGSPYHYRRGGY
jgi:hypothetical protein